MFIHFLKIAKALEIDVADFFKLPDSRIVELEAEIQQRHRRLGGAYLQLAKGI